MIYQGISSVQPGVTISHCEGYLPPLPQLGVSMRYTHYFGDGVAWSDREKRYKNPQQWRWSIDYTSVPLLTLAYYHHTGFSGQTKHRLGIELTYHFNLSLAQHLDPNQVVELYSAQGQRWSRISHEQMALNYTKVMSPKLQQETQAAFIDEDTKDTGGWEQQRWQRKKERQKKKQVIGKITGR